jgi:hypothetical protein
MTDISAEEEPVNMWRAATLRALLHAPVEVANRQDRLATLIGDMAYMLGPLFNNTSKQVKAIDKFQLRIMNPAADLAILMRTSPATYCFESAFAPSTETQATSILRKDLGLSNMIDAESGRAIKASRTLHFKNDGKFGEELCIIHPALICHGKRGQEMRLRKATTLVKLDGRLVSESRLGNMVRHILDSY